MYNLKTLIGTLKKYLIKQKHADIIRALLVENLLSDLQKGSKCWVQCKQTYLTV